jgi:oxalate---CoA ligase
MVPSDAPCTTLSALLDLGRLRSAGGSALCGGGGVELSHAQLQVLLLAAERDLRAVGIGRRTRVMTALPDGALTACVLLALTRSAVCAPVNPDLRKAELELLVPELGAEVLVVVASTGAEARRVAEAAGLPVIEVGWNATLDGLQWSGVGLQPAAETLGDAGAEDLALILLTSGSSARPKRVPLTQGQLALSALRMAGSLALTEGDRCLNLMPMFHVGAVVDLMLAPLAMGGSVLRPDAMTVASCLEALQMGRATWFQGVPTLLHEVALRLEQAGQRIKCLRLVRSVSSPLPLDWIPLIETAFGAPVIEIYGMTETAGIITSNPLPPAAQKVGSVGVAVGLEVCIRGGSGEAAGPGVRGEILVRGAGVMSGYEGMDNAAFFDAEGWLRTGDEGCFDAEGYWFITGRIGEQINRGGEKVSPREVDEVLLDHPAVEDAAAFAMPHVELGQEVAAAVVLRAGVPIGADALAQHVNARLAYFKVPKAFYVVPELPRGPGGKLRRRLLPEIVRELLPLADARSVDSASADGADEPLSPMEKQVAAWWAEELQVTEVLRGADFFDLGGDSLAAGSVTFEVEKALGVTVRPAALFDHPTVQTFAAYLDAALAERTPGAAAVELAMPPANSGMDVEHFRRLHAVMRTWPGAFGSEVSVVVGHRTDAGGVPLFWCGQGFSEFGWMLGGWPVEHPIYGMRSLYLFEGKTREDELALARVFASEVETLRAGREVVLGGFCAGARIAFHAALLLRERGVPIRLLFLHEFMPPEPIDVPVALGFCKESVCDPRRRYGRPEVVMARRFPGGWHSVFMDAPHNGLFKEHVMPMEVRRLQALLADPSGLHQASPQMMAMPPTACRALISCWLYPRLLVAGWRGWARVKVVNESQHDWPASESSGFYLGHRWLDAAGQVVGDPGESMALPRAVPSKSAIVLTLPFTAPLVKGPHTLEIDMVNEGVSWFSARSSRKPSKALRLVIKSL